MSLLINITCKNAGVSSKNEQEECNMGKLETGRLTAWSDSSGKAHGAI